MGAPMINTFLLYSQFKYYQYLVSPFLWFNAPLLHFSSVQSLSRVPLFPTPWTARLPCPSPIPGAYSNSCPLSWWCHPTISSSIVPFSSHLHFFPASGSFPMSQFFASVRQSTGVSASTSVLPMNIHNWFPLVLTGLISLQAKGLSILLQHHSSKASILQCLAFFTVQLSDPYMTTHIHTWLHTTSSPSKSFLYSLWNFSFKQNKQTSKCILYFLTYLKIIIS